MKITEAEALTLFNTGHRVRLENKRGHAPYGWNSIATGYFGLREFYAFRKACTDHAERYGMGVLHWVKPAPSSQTKDDALGHIYRREPFKIGHLSGSFAFDPTTKGFFGVLPQKHVDDFMMMWYDPDVFGTIDYVVWSYDTVIAWVQQIGGPIMPPVRYSNTTTQHQHAVAQALGIKDFSATDGSFRKGKGKTPFTPRSW